MGIRLIQDIEWAVIKLSSFALVLFIVISVRKMEKLAQISLYEDGFYFSNNVVSMIIRYDDISGVEFKRLIFGWKVLRVRGNFNVHVKWLGLQKRSAFDFHESQNIKLDFLYKEIAKKISP